MADAPFFAFASNSAILIGGRSAYGCAFALIFYTCCVTYPVGHVRARLTSS